MPLYDKIIGGYVKFIGRVYEQALLKKQSEKGVASLIAVYGRRRVGKTCLIEESYKNRTVWKFDGLEKESKEKQISAFLSSLSKYAKDSLYETAACKNWLDVFKLLDRAINESKQKYQTVIFFDELPYMANRRTEMISDLKWAWDNLWSNKKGFTLVLCGSVASFMVDSVINSSALYGRINMEICLKPFLLEEVYEFFGKRRSQREIINLYMFCGGIPAYLALFDDKISVAANINALAFCKDGYFINEFQRIFKDVFYEDRVYKKIILLFSKYKSLKVTELLSLLSMSEGSGFNRYLDNLERAGFIKSYVPLGSPDSSKLKRYQLEDEYLYFYYKFIKPNLKKIENNTNKDLFSLIMFSRAYQSWAGLAFERVCLKHANVIMQILKIDQLVKDYGAYFDRKTNTKEGVQIDLLFERHDPVITVCEMKFYSGKIGKWIIDEVEKKVKLIEHMKKSIEKILITTEGITKDLEDTHYFSKIILAEKLFGIGSRE